MEATRERRTTRRVISLVASSALVVGMTGMVALPAGATGSTCRARNLDTLASSSDLQGLVTVAIPGDTILVRGICVGNYAIDRDLTVAGRGTLDGGGNGTVLTVGAGVHVIIRRLLITNGNGEFGGGIANHGSLTLTGSSSVSGNVASDGGGAVNHGSLTLSGSASVTGNTAAHWGGGITTRGSSPSTDDPP